MSTTVLLIRHPESAWNRRGIYQGQRDTPLSALGRVQAELVADRLSKQRIDGVVCSPLRRARLLAGAIGRRHRLEAEPQDGLTEIAHGTWESLSREQVRERFPDMYRTWSERPHDVSFPGGESLHDVHARAVPIVESLFDGKGGVRVVVTHDTVCRLVVAAAQGQGPEGFACVQLENAGITTLEGPELLGSLIRVNDVEHLGAHRVQLETQAL